MKTRIEEGISFKDFVKLCARSFGEVGMMEEPDDAEFPTEKKPSSYHLEELEKAKEKLVRHKTVTRFAAASFARKEYKAKLDEKLKSLRETSVLLAKCKVLLVRINDWTPPTPGHYDLKDFMITYINRLVRLEEPFVKYDQTPGLRTAEQWLKEEKQSILADIEYHCRKYEEEVERAKSDTKWIQDLLKSL